MFVEFICMIILLLSYKITFAIDIKPISRNRINKHFFVNSEFIFWATYTPNWAPIMTPGAANMTILITSEIISLPELVKK